MKKQTVKLMTNLDFIASKINFFQETCRYTKKSFPINQRMKQVKIASEGKSSESMILHFIGLFVPKIPISCKVVAISPSFVDSTGCY